MGERWRAFKATLTRRYLNNGDLSHKSPVDVYPFIDDEIWQAFIKTREDPSFQVSCIHDLVVLSNILVLYLIGLLFTIGEKKEGTNDSIF